MQANTYGQGNAGNVILNATKSITLNGSSVFNTVGAVNNNQNNIVKGNGGNIQITTDQLSLNDAQLAASTFGQGNAGSVIINVTKSFSLDNAVVFSTVGAVNSNQNDVAKGNGGNIQITTGQLSLANDAQFLTNTYGQGNAGNIQITTGQLSLSNSAQILASTLSQGDAGNVIINATKSVFLDGKDTAVFSNVGEINNTLNNVVKGNGGNIQITTDQLSLSNGADLVVSTLGQGNAGNVVINATKSVYLNNAVVFNTVGATNNTLNNVVKGNGGNIQITTDQLSLTNGAKLLADTYGQGNAGNVKITATNAVTFDGVNSGSFSRAYNSGVGNGGNINITAGSLSLTNGGELDVSVQGASSTLAAAQGNGGTINLNLRDALIISGTNSRIYADLGTGAVGRGGDIKVQSGDIFVTNGGQIRSSTFGKGNAGNISITANNEISLDSASYIASNVQDNNAQGNAGNIEITTGSLRETRGSQINSFTSGKGNAGNVTITATGVVTFDGVNSDLISSVEAGGVGNGGNINITAGSLSLTNSAQFETSTFGQGNAGNVVINVTKGIFFDGGYTNSNGQIFSSGILSNVGAVNNNQNNLVKGNGGNIQITTDQLSLTNGAQLQVITFGQGNAGNVTINATKGVSLDGNGTGIYSTVGSVNNNQNNVVKGNGGNIRVGTDSLSLSNGAVVSAITVAKGDAGNIFIQASGSVSLTNSSYITSNIFPGGVGNSGDVDINTKTLTLTNGSQVQAGPFRQSGNLPGGKGNGGEIRINASDSVNILGYDSNGFSSGLLTLTETGASGNAGSIYVTTGDFRVADGAVVNAATFNNGNAGDITINANTLEAVNGGQIITLARSSGNAGTIRLNVKDSMTLTGSDPNYAQRLAQIDEQLKLSGSTDTIGDRVDNQGAASGIFANTAPGSTGSGGSIFIDPRLVTIKDGATISVSSDGTGIAGNLTVNASSIRLDNGTLIANTRSNKTDLNKEQATITVSSSDLILRHGSNITTNATGNNVIGGNINIDTDVLAALENSYISANSADFRGGKVRINTSGIFLSPESTITATGASPLFNGIVQINTSDINPAQGLLQLSTNLINPNALIANSCIARTKKQQGTFNITGTGGLPNHPGDAFMSSYPTGTVRNVGGNSISSSWHKGDPIVEPQGVYQLPNGHLVLSRECS